MSLVITVVNFLVQIGRSYTKHVRCLYDEYQFQHSSVLSFCYWRYMALTAAVWGMDKCDVLLQSVPHTIGVNRTTHIIKALWDIDGNNPHWKEEMGHIQWHAGSVLNVTTVLNWFIQARH
jgi:hypothetical protein